MKENKKEDLASDVRDILINKQAIIEEMKQLVISRDYKLLDFTELDDNGYTEYMEGMYVKNLTSPILHFTGMTILHVKITKDVEFELHEHESQSQIIYVIEGSITDLKHKLSFGATEAYFVSKKHTHGVRYSQGTVALLIYLPNLKGIKT